MTKWQYCAVYHAGRPRTAYRFFGHQQQEYNGDSFALIAALGVDGWEVIQWVGEGLVILKRPLS